VVLKGHFHISTQELCDVVVEAEKDTKSGRRKWEKKRKVISYESESEEEVEEDAMDESESEIEDCIIVNVE
jgi:hypothetical protein